MPKVIDNYWWYNIFISIKIYDLNDCRIKNKNLIYLWLNSKNFEPLSLKNSLPLGNKSSSHYTELFAQLYFIMLNSEVININMTSEGPFLC